MPRPKNVNKPSDKPNSNARVQHETEVTERQRRVWQLTIAGDTTRAIAETLGVSRQTVTNLRKKELEEVQSETFGLAEQWRSVQLERLDTLMLTYWTAATNQAKILDKNDNVVFVPTKDGVKAAELVLKIMQQRNELLGLKTEKVEHSGALTIQWTDALSKDDDIGAGANELP